MVPVALLIGLSIFFGTSSGSHAAQGTPTASPTTTATPTTPTSASASRFAFPYQPQGNFAVAAYLPEWRYEGANWDTIATHVSHLILFSLEPAPDGRILALDRLPRPELLQEARAATRRHDTALMVCFGGNGRSSGFSRMVRRKASRRRFVSELVRLLRRFDLDGVDYNWEYPGYVMGRGYQSEAEIKRDYRGLRALVKETRHALGTAAPITLAYYPDVRQERLLHQGGFEKFVDLMHMMSYDQQGTHHSSLEYGRRMAEQGAELLQAAVVTAGLPFYGRLSSSGDWRSYEDLVQAHWPLDPSLDTVPHEGAELGFNGVRTIEARVAHAAQLGLGGVMIWEVGQDCRLVPVTHGDTTHQRTCPGEGDSASLLAAISRSMASAGAERVRFMATGGEEDTAAAGAATHDAEL